MTLLLSLLLACSDYGFGTKAGHVDPDGTSTGPSTDDDSAGGSTDSADTGGDPGINEGGPDTGNSETGIPDTGTPDSGTPDTGIPDTGTPDTGTPDTGTPDTGTPDTGWDTAGESLCDYAARTTGYLDRYQTPGDGRVLFCHNQGGGHFTEIETDISACEPHLDHRYDVFPTTGCDS